MLNDESGDWIDDPEIYDPRRRQQVIGFLDSETGKQAVAEVWKEIEWDHANDEDIGVAVFAKHPKLKRSTGYHGEFFIAIDEFDDGESRMICRVDRNGEIVD